MIFRSSKRREAQYIFTGIQYQPLLLHPHHSSFLGPTGVGGWLASPLPFPLVLIAGFAAGGKLEQDVNPSGSPVLRLIPTHIALAPPDIDLSGGPSWQKCGYCPVPKRTQGQSLHDQLPLTGWVKQDHKPQEQDASTMSPQKGTARPEGRG